MRTNPLAASPDDRKTHVQRLSSGEGKSRDANEAPPQYGKLVALWEVGKDREPRDKPVYKGLSAARRID